MSVLNTGITSKEEILKVSRAIVTLKGLSAVNMRSVADACHIALGTLYNYYANKDDLLLAIVEDIWKDIFHMEKESMVEVSFPQYVEYILECVQKSTEKYPDFLTAHSMVIASSGKEKAKSTMKRCFEHMKKGMLQVLQADRQISEHAFSTSFCESEFIDFVLDYIFILLVQGKTNCEMLKEIIQRTIYLS